MLNGIAFDSTTQSLWVTGKYWPKMYNITFTVPKPDIQDPPGSEIIEEEIITSTTVNSIFSEAILFSLLTLTVILWAMNLKDGGPNPPDRGPSE